MKLIKTNYQGDREPCQRKLYNLMKELSERITRTDKNQWKETLNELLDQETKQLTGAAKYEQTYWCQGYRSGTYSRKLGTTTGEVSLKIRKSKGIPFETTIIERY